MQPQTILTFIIIFLHATLLKSAPLNESETDPSERMLEFNVNIKGSQDVLTTTSTTTTTEKSLMGKISSSISRFYNSVKNAVVGTNNSKEKKPVVRVLYPPPNGIGYNPGYGVYQRALSAGGLRYNPGFVNPNPVSVDGLRYNPGYVNPNPVGVNGLRYNPGYIYPRPLGADRLRYNPVNINPNPVGTNGIRYNPGNINPNPLDVDRLRYNAGFINPNPEGINRLRYNPVNINPNLVGIDRLRYNPGYANQNPVGVNGLRYNPGYINPNLLGTDRLRYNPDALTVTQPFLIPIKAQMPANKAKPGEKDDARVQYFANQVFGKESPVLFNDKKLEERQGNNFNISLHGIINNNNNASSIESTSGLADATLSAGRHNKIKLDLKNLLHDILAVQNQGEAV